ncbi:uncharacterized protein LOC135464193 [Liolophura sinensis]|uniref:uncharacterized protein LOC135464193 n=1 Tax=Liolophura sinensis TaxID=3198878 RepID=UPI003159498B
MDHDWPEEGEDEGFADGEIPEDNAMETDMSAEGEDELMEGARATTYFYGDPSTLSDGEDFSKAQVEKLMKSEPYQRKISTCHLCGQCWYDNQVTADCLECGGFPLTRPCPVCDGECSAVWDRNVKKSHSYHKAHWEGKCTLPPDMQQVLLGIMTDSNEDRLTESMQDLSTS